jgi:PAS domain S-box-containing protein
MTLRKKTLSIIGLILVLLIGTLYLTSRYIVLGGFNELEEHDAQHAVERVQNATEENLSNLASLARFWAARDDTYDFIQDTKEHYLKSNLLSESTFSSNRLSLVLFINADGQAVFAGSYDLRSGKPTAMPPSIADHIAPDSPLLQHPDADSHLRGLLALPEGPLLIASEPILDSTGNGPVRGTLVVGRFLDTQEIDRLARLTGLMITIQPINAPSLPADFQTALRALGPDTPRVAGSLDNGPIAGYALANDIYGRPAFVWRSDMPRSVLAQGQATILYFVITLLALGVLFAGATLLLLEKLVLARVSDLSAKVVSIGVAEDLSARVSMAGDDELSTLGESINGMLAALEHSQGALQASEERYRRMFTKNGAIKLVVDPSSGVIVDANPAAFEFYGCPADLLLNMKMTDISPLPAQQVMAEMAWVAAERSTYFETRHRLATGDIRDVEVYASPIDVKGRPLLYAIIHDITERKRAQALIRSQVERLAALRNIDTAIKASLDLPTTLHVILEQTRTQLGVDAADVLLLDPRAQTLQYAAGQGFCTDIMESTLLRMGQSYAGHAALERRVVSIAALPDTPDFASIPGIQEEGFVAYFAVPLVAREQVKGVLEVFHRSSLDTDPEWLDFLEAVTAQAAIAIDNATLVDALQHSNAELARAYDRTLEGWSRALDLRDKETDGHSRRVTEMTLRLARAMGVSEADLVHIRRGALLHDIGKMGIPDRILLKPGPLTDEEWEIMRRHPTYSYELLAPIAFLRPALDIPYCHHEKWDGSGYPRRLKGVEIPLAARIFAVVDVWDALRANRPYRNAWREEMVRAHIRSLSGTHFDPDVVESFLALDPPEQQVFQETHVGNLLIA